ncbi:MAG: hypothetical protein VB878_08275 [Pirellulaceae bacterium]
MISRYRREYAIISFLTLFAVLLRTPSIRAAEDAASIIPDYSSYVEVDFLRVSVGTVRAKKRGETGWHIAIETCLNGAIISWMKFRISSSSVLTWVT